MARRLGRKPNEPFQQGATVNKKEQRAKAKQVRDAASQLGTTNDQLEYGGFVAAEMAATALALVEHLNREDRMAVMKVAAYSILHGFNLELESEGIR